MPSGGIVFQSPRSTLMELALHPGFASVIVPLGPWLQQGCRRQFSRLASEPAVVALNLMNATDVNLYLVGFMGTGKTTIGRAAAQRIGFELLDSDHEIERHEGKTIADIFAGPGEAAFRDLERKFIESGHPATRTVVSCGGGLVVQPGMLELLNARGVVICLHASIETILVRTGRHQHRPLLNVEDPVQRVKTLYAEREPIYKRAGTVILTDSRSMNDIVGHVIRAWRREAMDFARKQL